MVNIILFINTILIGIDAFLQVQQTNSLTAQFQDVRAARIYDDVVIAVSNTGQFRIFQLEQDLREGVYLPIQYIGMKELKISNTPNMEGTSFELEIFYHPLLNQLYLIVGYTLGLAIYPIKIDDFIHERPFPTAVYTEKTSSTGFVVDFEHAFLYAVGTNAGLRRYYLGNPKNIVTISISLASFVVPLSPFGGSSISYDFNGNLYVANSYGTGGVTHINVQGLDAKFVKTFAPGRMIRSVFLDKQNHQSRIFLGTSSFSNGVSGFYDLKTGNIIPDFTAQFPVYSVKPLGKDCIIYGAKNPSPIMGLWVFNVTESLSDLSKVSPMNIVTYVKSLVPYKRAVVVVGDNVLAVVSLGVTGNTSSLWDERPNYSYYLQNSLHSSPDSKLIADLDPSGYFVLDNTVLNVRDRTGAKFSFATIKLTFQKTSHSDPVDLQIRKDINWVSLNFGDTFLQADIDNNNLRVYAQGPCNRLQKLTWISFSASDGYFGSVDNVNLTLNMNPSMHNLNCAEQDKTKLFIGLTFVILIVGIGMGIFTVSQSRRLRVALKLPAPPALEHDIQKEYQVLVNPKKRVNPSKVIKTSTTIFDDSEDNGLWGEFTSG